MEPLGVQGYYSSWDNVELWMLMEPLGVIMVITVHVTTPFLRPFLFGTNFFAHVITVVIVWFSRTQLELSKRWGTLSMANQLFKIYFRVSV